MTGRQNRPDEPRPSAGHAGDPLLTGVVRWLQEGVVLVDDEGRVAEVTPSACELLGVAERHLVGLDALEPVWTAIDRSGAVVPGASQPVAVARRTGRDCTAVLGVDRPDGTRVWLKVSAVPIPAAGAGAPRLVVTFVDVTEGESARLRLEESEQRFRLTLEHAPIGMAIVALDGTFVVVNQRLAEMFQLTAEGLVGRTFQELTHPDDLAGDLALVDSLVQGRMDSYTTEKRYLAADGSVVWARLAVAVVRAHDGRPLHFVSQVEDVTGARRVEDLLAEGALFDPLTGLANRALTVDRARRAAGRNRRAGRSVALLCCGIDGLKLVNRSLGHAAGDALIAAVAARIVEVVGADDLVGRGDGDEFFVLVEGLDRSEVPVGLIQRIRDGVSGPIDVQGHELRPVVSIGVALGDGADTDDDLLHDAATALLEAKGRGRGEWALFERRIRARAVQRLTIETELRQAVGRGELELHFQPIVDLATRRPVAYEALARWRHPSAGLLLPARFIPVAEESGLIDELGAHLLDLACAFLARRSGRGTPVFVNVSPSQLRSGAFPSVVSGALGRHGVASAQLGIELTESTVLHATGSSYRALQELAELGIDLVLDDFGTGYSAIAALLAAPITGIKLDRSFTSRLGVDSQADLVTRALGGMVEALGFRGVAEGVETEAQLEAVRSHGWRLGQGYLFGRAVPEDELPPDEPRPADEG